METMTTTNMIDWDVIYELSLFEGDDGFLSQCLDDFGQRAQLHLDQMVVLHRQADWSALAAVAHRLCGSAIALGAAAVRDASASLEDRARAREAIAIGDIERLRWLCAEATAALRQGPPDRAAF